MNESPITYYNSKISNRLIDGNSIATEIRSVVARRILSLRSTTKLVPGLAVILVGDRKDSQTYVRMKKKACTDCGIVSFGFDYSSKVQQEVLLSKIDLLNKDSSIHGILVQLPLPNHIDEDTILRSIHPDKDVDGLHPLNTSKLYYSGTHLGFEKVDWKNLDTVPFHIPCTPQGCIELLDRINVSVCGKDVVVVGRSNLVGLPIAMLLLHRNASVTVVHSKTVDPQRIVSRADIVIVAIGNPKIVTGDWIKKGAIVIDVGINSISDPDCRRGYRLIGDVDYLRCIEVVSKITPVPGGVGPMTIAMLLRNTVNAYMRMINITNNQEM